MNRQILMERIENSKDSKEILHLRGQLINLLKEEIKEEKDANVKQQLDLALYDEMKKHKEHITKMKEEAKEKKYPISERLALKVKEIAATMEIFMKKSDVLGRLKNGSISAIIAGIFTGAISVGISMISGAPFTMATIASIIPTVSYVGLSSLITSMLDGTNKSKMYEKYENAPEEARQEIKFCKECISENERFVKAAVAEPQLKDLDDKIRNEKILISEYEKIIEQAPTDQLKQVITLEMIDVMKNLEYNYSYKENEYLNNRVSMSEEEYNQLTKERNELNHQIKVTDSFAKDTVKTMAKNIGKQTAITYAARIALTGLFPSLQFTSFTDALTPFLYTLLGNAFTFGSISNKIKAQKTDYTGTIIKVTHPELFEKERQRMQTPAMQVA